MAGGHVTNLLLLSKPTGRRRSHSPAGNQGYQIHCISLLDSVPNDWKKCRRKLRNIDLVMQLSNFEIEKGLIVTKKFRHSEILGMFAKSSSTSFKKCPRHFLKTFEFCNCDRLRGMQTYWFNNYGTPDRETELIQESSPGPISLSLIRTENTNMELITGLIDRVPLKQVFSPEVCFWQQMADLVVSLWLTDM